jgi:hypothetical protein
MCFFEHLTTDNRAVDISVGVYSNTFGAAVFDGGGFHVFDEVLHRTVFCTSMRMPFFHRADPGPTIPIGDVDTYRLA